ncbi:MAG: helix-turn-helix domain-containing protein [Bryobacteraceae bacterium]
MASSLASKIRTVPNATSAPQDREYTVLTITEIAKILRCSKAHVSNALKGKVPGIPPLTHFALGRRKLVKREWLDRWMEANKIQC